MSELVERLRTPFADAGIIHEAADAIEALSARVEALEAGLRDIAKTSRDEGGCFYNNRISIAIARRLVPNWHLSSALSAAPPLPADTPSTSSTPDAPRAAASVSGGA